jgi:hypothetical protein
MKVRSITTAALALAFLALSGRAALAQDRGQNRGQNRRPDATRDSTPATPAQPAPTPAPTPESSNGADAQGGHVTSDADRAAIAADQARKAEQARQAAQGNPQGVQGRSNQGQNRGQDRSTNSGQDRGQDRNYNGQDRGQDRNYNGQDRGQDRNYNGQDRRYPQGGRSFTDRDRQVTRQWYQQHRNRLGPGWRDRDRLDSYWEGRLRRGQRLDPRLRQQMYWLPPDLAMMYGPAPRGYRYAIIGGNIVLLDDYYNVQDVFRIDLRF